jgi:TonB-linked SusC/RagA family outer membrane protein
MTYKEIKILSIIIIASICTFSYAQTIIPDSLKKEQSPRTIAYGVQPNWQVNGSISTIKGDELSKSFNTNVSNTLYGRLPGLTVQQGGGEAGTDAPTISARGVNTFGTGRGIYVLIDGFPSTEKLFEQLTSEEIESVSLLKDASTTAIYGDRGANGVLLVTTKRGQKSPMKVNLGVQYGFQQADRLPQFLGSYDYARLYNEALVNDGLSPKYTQADLTAYQNGNDPIYHPNVNWYNELLRGTSPLVNYNFNARGGSETVRYYVLFNVVNNNGIYVRTADQSTFTKDESYSRYNFRTNVDITLSKNLSAMINLGGTVEDKTNPGVDGNTNNVFNLMASVPSNAFPVFVAPNMPGGNSLYANPLSEITQRGYVSTLGRSAQISAKLTEDLGMITPGLSISGAIGFNSYFKSYSIKTRSYATYSVEPDFTGMPIYTQYGLNTSLGGNEGNSYQWRNTVFQGFLNYERTFGIHGINAMIMANYDDYTESNNYGDTGANTILPYKNVGMAGRFTYSFDKRYVGEFSFGYSGNDNFTPGNRFGFFPAGSLGWVASNEEFLKENSIVNYLKIKSSYGLTGNGNIGGTRFMYNQSYNNSGYNLGTDNGVRSALVQGSLANLNATWEKQKSFNVGIEATLFNSLDITFDYFIQNRYDILAKPYSTVPDYLGISLPDMNVGKVENKGFEATIRYNSDKKKDLNYFVEVSAWFAQNKITYNAEAPQLYNYLYSTGQSIGQPFLLQAIGFFKDQADINNSPKQLFTTVQPGDIKYKDQNGDGVINQSDYYPIGYTNMPKLTLSFHAGATYKGFDLDMLFQGAIDRSVYLYGSYFQAFQNYGSISSIALDRWTPETSSTANYPRLSSNNNLNNFLPSSFWQRNGDFLKLRNLEVGYSLPQNISQKLHLEKIRAFVNGTNLFSLDHMDGLMDPESVSGGVGYPVMRTLSLGLSIQL